MVVPEEDILLYVRKIEKGKNIYKKDERVDVVYEACKSQVHEWIISKVGKPIYFMFQEEFESAINESRNPDELTELIREKINTSGQTKAAGGPRGLAIILDAVYETVKHRAYSEKN